MARYSPPAEYLRECLTYSPETGLLFWRSRPESHFASVNACAMWNTRYAGSPAFASKLDNGYLVGRVAYRGRYGKTLAHRVAWAVHFGTPPIDQIDHINGDRTDNRISNLRLATQTENNWNSKRRGALPRGVAKNGKGYAARLEGKVRKYLGTYPTVEAAAAVWRAAATAERAYFFGGSV